jgi:hypothetical protein
MQELKLIDAVVQVLDEKYPETSYKFEMQPMDNIVSTMIELGFEVDEDEIDTNGWQMDFWLYCFKDGIKYLIDGSWYYGQYRFSKEG